MEKRKAKLGFLAPLLTVVLFFSAYALAHAKQDANVVTSCGKVVMTVSEEDSDMSEKEYVQYLRDINEWQCGNRNRPNVY